MVGRVFTWEEAQDSISPILIGYEVWQRRFNGDPGIVGRSVEIGGGMFPVIGVLPVGFVLPNDFGSPNVSEVYFPQYVDLDSPAQVPFGGGNHGNYGVARLKEGHTATSGLADLEKILDRLRAEGVFTEERNFHPRVYAVMDDILGTARGTIFVLLGAVGFVLLIACGNVANLLLSRSEVRMKEVAVRVAIGAGRGRIIRQLFTESLVMAGLAGAIGLGLAYVGVGALLAIDPDAVPRSASISLDGTVVMFTLLVSALTAAVFGVIPALRVSRGSVGSTLQEGGRDGRGGMRSSRMQGLLVAAQMAMAVVLLTESGLMIKTFISLLGIDPGFSATNVLTMRVTASSGGYPDGEAVAGFYEELLRRVRDLPGVKGAGAARLLPLASQMGDSGFRPAWYQPEPNESTQADWQYVTSGYIETMDIPLVAGRTFDERDVRDGQTVVMINEHLARRYWGEDSPLGSEVLAFGADTTVVVGVVGNVSHNGITMEVKDRYYLAHAQVIRTGSMRAMTLTIAAQGDANRLIEPIRREIRTMDPSMPISDIRTVDDVLSASVAQPRFAMVLLGAFSGLALILAVVGIYGVLAYTVSQRIREIGIRLALGAETGQVIGLVVRQGMLMALAGVAVGTGAAWFMTDLMQGLLYGVTAQDATTFVSVPALFTAVALLACWLPAARAARVRPASALRYE